MDPRNYSPDHYLEDLVTQEELDAEMREWDERNGITYEDGEDGELDYEADDSWEDWQGWEYFFDGGDY